jgi:hypothetical protein
MARLGRCCCFGGHDCCVGRVVVIFSLKEMLWIYGDEQPVFFPVRVDFLCAGNLLSLLLLAHQGAA